MLSEAEILDALRDCYDTELNLNIVDLGQVCAVETGPDPDATEAWPRQWAKIAIRLTVPPPVSDPQGALLVEQARNRLAGIPELSSLTVEVVQEPAWTPQAISATGRKRLGL
jgi:metal-sulfur cluster biosynthetic enzyme